MVGRTWQRSPEAQKWALEQNQAGSVNSGQNDHSCERNGWSLKKQYRQLHYYFLFTLDG